MADDDVTTTPNSGEPSGDAASETSAAARSGRRRGPRGPRDSSLSGRAKAIIAVLVLAMVVVGLPQVLSVMTSFNRSGTDPATALGGDVALVLGAPVEADGQPSAELAGRLAVAEQLYRLKTVKVLLVSGDGRPAAHDQPAAMKKWLVAKGVPADRIVEDPYGYSTYDSCARAKRVHNLPSAVIVTQKNRLDRAVATCALVNVGGAYGVGDTSYKDADPWVWRLNTLKEIPARIGLVYDWATEGGGDVHVADAPNHAVEKALAVAG